MCWSVDRICKGRTVCVADSRPKLNYTRYLLRISSFGCACQQAHKHRCRRCRHHLIAFGSAAWFLALRGCAKICSGLTAAGGNTTSFRTPYRYRGGCNNSPGVSSRPPSSSSSSVLNILVMRERICYVSSSSVGGCALRCTIFGFVFAPRPSAPHIRRNRSPGEISRTFTLQLLL